MEADEPMIEEFLSETSYSSDRQDARNENNRNDGNDNDEQEADEDDEDDDEGSQSSELGTAALVELGTAAGSVDATEDTRKRHQCTECEKAYSKRKYLERHMQREHNINLPKAKRGRIAYLLQATEDNPRPYKCDQCIKGYAQLSLLTRHKRMHAQTFCDFCQKSFAFYEEHMRKEHNVELPRPFECDICGRSFRVKSTFQAHMRIHREENRVFNCTLCPKAFFQATDLRKHIKSHSNVRSVICDVCGDAFKSAETLKCHMRRHTGDRPYPCKVCPRAFTTSNSLMIHQRTHTNERPYACEVCQKRFSDLSTLLVHKRLHSGESPYICHLCSRRTKQASNLRSHYIHLHKIKDISGRQVRMNAKIFERFTQQEIDEHLKANGDLIALLAKGLEDYNNEQSEKTKMTEELIETMRAPLRPVKKETPDEEGQSVVWPTKSRSRKSGRKIENECNDSITPWDEAEPVNFKQEPLMDAYDSYTVSNGDEMEMEEKPVIASASSDQIESVFIIEQVDPGGDYDAMPAEVKEEYEEEQADWMNGDTYNDGPTENEIVKSEFAAEPVKRNAKKTKKTKKVKKMPKTNKVKRKKRPKSPPRTLSTCSVCQKRVRQLNVHTVECHPTVDRPFECFLCHKQFKKYKHISYHLRNHYRDERNFVCHMCGDAFLLNAELTKHIFNRHNDVRPFKCEQCHKSFKNRNALKVHMRSHTGEKLFQCTVCLESFSANSSLRLHFRRHTNERPYQCTYCGKRFADCSTHRQHERIHTGEKPYKCHLCDDTRTTQAGNLKSHYRHFHKMIVRHVSKTKLVTDADMIPIM